MTPRRFVIVVAVAVAGWVLVGCGGETRESSAEPEDPAVGSDDEFCESMEHLIVLLAPDGPTSPSDTEATFTEAGGWFEQARRSAPQSVSEEVAAYATAYDNYVHFLAESGWNLDVVFSTDEGHDLAIETSHTLTVPIVDYTTNECGLSFVVPG